MALKVGNVTIPTNGDNVKAIVNKTTIDLDQVDVISGGVRITVWKKQKYYYIRFNANGGTGTMEDQSLPVGTTVKLTENQFSKLGYLFSKWNTNANGSGTSYSDKQSVIDVVDPGENKTLYAIWQAITYYVAYNANGGTGTMANSTHTYDVAKELTLNTFTKSNCAFIGWSTNSNGSGTFYENKASVKNLLSTQGSTLNLYANWVQKTFDFSYTGGVQTFTAPATGTYLLEVYGAKGGGNGGFNDSIGGGLGGYSKGKVKLTKGQVLYVCVGQWPGDDGLSGGYNGGGSAAIGSGGFGGGGATHIGTKNSVLSGYGGTSGLLIVAGGGGGNGRYGSGSGAGGAGGGLSGYSGTFGTWNPTSYLPGGRAGTQSAGGAGGSMTNDLGTWTGNSGTFGKGGDAVGPTSGGGGGGLYGGGGGGSANGGACGGGGGSSYIGGVSDGDTLADINSGNGKAKISIITDDGIIVDPFYVVKNTECTSHALNTSASMDVGHSITCVPGCKAGGTANGTIGQKGSAKISVSYNTNGANILKLTFFFNNSQNYGGKLPVSILTITGYTSTGASVTLYNHKRSNLTWDQQLYINTDGYSKITINVLCEYEITSEDGNNYTIINELKEIYAYKETILT